MSCPNATAPIDISISNITGKCDLKCSYSFHYSNSSCIAKNRGEYISISYDKSSSPPVLYNATGYDVQEIRLYIPSLHSYNNRKTNGELIIVHTSNLGYKPLLVCIPIKSNNSSSFSALFFKTLVDTVASSAPSDGDMTTVNIPKFNLDFLVPKKPFFSYSATEPYQPCSENVEYIVFTPLESSLDIMDETLKKLDTIIKSNVYDIKKGPNLFYNEKGPSIGGGGNGEIYIDCQPVGSSEDTKEIIIDMGSSPYSMNMSDLFNNPYFKMFIVSFILIVILYGTKYLLKIIKPIKDEAIETITVGMKGGKWK
jgi:carbonic anhydrase